MIRFVYPELFLLALPLWFAYRRWGRATGVTKWLRLGLLGLLLVALAGPRLNLGGEGLDVVIVVDRSRSLPPGSEARIRELVLSVQNARRQGDRVGVVTFGGNVETEIPLSAEAVLGDYTKVILPDGSDLNAALYAALDLVKDPQRPARILVLSDGEANGASPLAAARQARDQGVPIDYRDFPRSRVGDVAVESLELPEVVSPREPFQYAVSVVAERPVEGVISILQDGRPVARHSRSLEAGRNRFVFRDLLEVGGTASYEVKVEVPDDPLPDNNLGAGVVRVDAGPRVLVLNSDGAEDNLTRALRAGNVPLDVVASKAEPLSRERLDRYRAVVLENIPASDLGRVKLERLAQFVEDLGGGLLVTGGERSFGMGGYFRSELDPVLPVSMEMREEHRKGRIALAIALDRSGSMTAPVRGGKVKMDLANLGTAECVRLLSPGDSVSVIAVDSSPHVVQPQTNVNDPEAIARKALKIQSEGGGIFVYEALVAAGRELNKAEQSTRHVILFSDAADSEEPGDYKTLLKKFEAAQITVSVIGLGSKSDPDARLLEDIARLGKGNIMFTQDAEELPRLFTQDTMSVARSSFIKKDETQPAGIPAEVVPSAQLMGEYASGQFPNTDGYNLSYLKPDATLGVVTTDEYAAPLSAFWYKGLGRAAAITIEMDGAHTGAVAGWSEYADFAITHVRWLLGGDTPDQAFVRMAREGQDAVVTLELDPDRPTRQQAEAPELWVVMPGDNRAAPQKIPFQWRGANELEVRFRLNETGAYRGVVVAGGKRLVGTPAVTLPYSPEFMPRAGLPEGGDVLKTVAETSGGEFRLEVADVLRAPPRAAGVQSLAPWLFLLAILALVLEIAGRRLSLWSLLARTVRGDEQEAAAAIAGSSPLSETATRRAGWPNVAWPALPAWASRGRAARQAPSMRSATGAPSGASPSAAPPAGAPTEPEPVEDVFAAAKQRARRRN